MTYRLIVAAKLHPTPIVMSLIDFVRPSRPIVVFSPYKEVKKLHSNKPVAMNIVKFDMWMQVGPVPRFLHIAIGLLAVLLSQNTIVST